MAIDARFIQHEGDLDIVDNEAAHRYEAWLDDEQAGIIEYIPTDGSLVFDHTEVPEAFEGRGIGSRLAKAALDDVRARGLVVESQCPFVTAYVQRHPAYADVVRKA